MKTKGSAILLILLIAGGGLLFAQDPTILIVAKSEAAEPVVLELQSLLTESVPEIVMTDHRKAIVEEYDRANADRAYLLDQARAYARKQPVQPRGEVAPYTESLLVSTYVSKPYNPDLLSLFEREEALNWYLNREQAIGVFLVDVTAFDQARRVRLSYGEGSRYEARPIYDRLLIAMEDRTLIEELLAQAVYILTDGTKALLKIEGSKEINVVDESQRIDSLDLYLVPAETSAVTVGRSGYEPRKVAVIWEEGRVATVTPNLQRIVNEPITLLSDVGTVQYASEDEGRIRMITLGSPSYPIALSIEKRDL